MANKQQKSDSYQPQTVIWREHNYEVHLGQVLGVLDFDNNFDNQFQKWKLMIQFITDVQEAIKQDIIPLKSKGMEKELMPNPIAIMKMEKIWNETTYLGVVKDHNNTQVLLREFFYEKPSPIYIHKDETGKILDTYKREVIPFVKLKNMLPVGEIDSDYWGIQIKESMALRYAWQGANYATIINDGKFVHNLSDGLIPKIEARDMKSLVKRTYILHRPVYNAIMDILPKYFNQNYFIFAGNVQRIMKWMKEQDMTWLYELDLETEQKTSSDDIFNTEN